MWMCKVEILCICRAVVVPCEILPERYYVVTSILA